MTRLSSYIHIAVMKYDPFYVSSSSRYKGKAKMLYSIFPAVARKFVFAARIEGGEARSFIPIRWLEKPSCETNFGVEERKSAWTGAVSTRFGFQEEPPRNIGGLDSPPTGTANATIKCWRDGKPKNSRRWRGARETKRVGMKSFVIGFN